MRFLNNKEFKDKNYDDRGKSNKHLYLGKYFLYKGKRAKVIAYASTTRIKVLLDDGTEKYTSTRSLKEIK